MGNETQSRTGGSLHTPISIDSRSKAIPIRIFFFFEALYQLSWQLSWERICLQCRRPRFDSWVGKIPWRRDRLPTSVSLGFPCGSAGKESTCKAGDLGSVPGLGRSGFSPWVAKIPWRRERLPTPVFWPGESHGLYSPRSRKESEKTDFYSHFHQVLWSNRLIQKTVSDLNNWIWKKKIFSLFPKRPWYNRHGTCSVKAVS